MTDTEVAIHPLLAKIKSNATAVPRGLPVFDDDLIPDTTDDLAPRDDGFDQYLDRIGIVEAYNRWANKGTVDARGKTESIKVRCPNPDHEDKNPSAWLNTTKGPGGVGMCRACGDLGFDKFTIYAWNHGVTTPGQPIGPEFPDVRRRMAEELGAVVIHSGGSSFVVHTEKPEQVNGAGPGIEAIDRDPSGVQESEGSPDVASGDVGSLLGRESGEPDGDGAGGCGDLAGVAPPPSHHPLLAKMRESKGLPEPSILPDEDPVEVKKPKEHKATVTPIAKKLEAVKAEQNEFDVSIDWETMLTPGTFLEEWMRALTIKTDVPHEYILFNGFVALGAMAKRNVYFNESRRVYPNLMVLLFGDTSTGKSRSFDPLDAIIDMVDPFDDSEPDKVPLGTKRLGVFGSGESLISGLRKNILDPATGIPMDHVGVSALAKMEEFSLAMAMARRPGGSFKEYLMSIYDTGYAKHTSLSSGDLHVSEAYLQVVSTTQPDAVYEFLRASDAFSGFLNRWVMVSGKNRSSRPLSIQPPLPDLSFVANLLTEVRDWADEEHGMSMTGEAFETWDTFYESGMRQVQAEGSPLLARWDLTLKKIILLLTMNEMLDEPTPAIVSQAVDFIFPYMRNVYSQFGEKMADNDRERVFEDAINYIEAHHKRHGEWPSPRDMKKSGVGKKHGGMKVVDACDWAAKMGLIGKVASARSTRYAIVSD